MNALLRTLVWMLALAVVALPVVAVLQGWIGAERWPLTTLRVTGELVHVEDAELREAILPHAQQGFFATRLADAQQAVAALPWVESAQVRKRWPDVLEVHVVEHRPFARWGSDRLLSDEGRLFPAAGIDPPPRLPQLNGPDSRVTEVVALYNESRALFTPTGYEVSAVDLDTRGSWSLLLSNGTRIVVGSRQARPRLERFARLLPQLLQYRTERLQRADLRYTNGFALVWGEVEEGADAQQPGNGLASTGSQSPTRIPDPQTT